MQFGMPERLAFLEQAGVTAEKVTPVFVYLDAARKDLAETLRTLSYMREALDTLLCDMLRDLQDCFEPIAAEDWNYEGDAPREQQEEESFAATAIDRVVDTFQQAGASQRDTGRLYRKLNLARVAFDEVFAEVPGERPRDYFDNWLRQLLEDLLDAYAATDDVDCEQLARAWVDRFAASFVIRPLNKMG